MLLITVSMFSQDKLGTSKSQLNSKNSSSSKSSSSSSSSSDSYDGEDLGTIIEVLLYVPVGVFKYGLIGDYNSEEHLDNELTAYPFYEDGKGNYHDTEGDSVDRKQLRFDIENHFIYSNNDLFGNHLEAKVRPFQYFYVQADYYQLFEFNKFDDSSNQLSLFYFNLGYDRIRFERFNLGWTVGASYVGNEVKKAGFSYGLKADYFLVKNVSFGAAAKWSFINQHPVHNYKLQTRFHKKNYFIGAEFEHLKIGSPVYNFIGIGGGIYF